MVSARERTGRIQACDVVGCPGCEDCPGGRHFERTKGRGQHNHIRVQTYGMPSTVERMRAGKNVPESWRPKHIPGIPGVRPDRYVWAEPVSTVGFVVLLGLARSHEENAKTSCVGG